MLAEEGSGESPRGRGSGRHVWLPFTSPHSALSPTRTATPSRCTLLRAAPPFQPTCSTLSSPLTFRTRGCLLLQIQAHFASPPNSSAFCFSKSSHPFETSCFIAPSRIQGVLTVPKLSFIPTRYIEVSVCFDAPDSEALYLFQ